jgi:hypothetical protein
VEEMGAGNLMSTYLFMGDLSMPFDGPITVAEDNAAMCIITHTGKLTCNIQSIALKIISLQALVREHLALLCAIAGSAQNKADHFCHHYWSSQN